MACLSPRSRSNKVSNRRGSGIHGQILGWPEALPNDGRVEIDNNSVERTIRPIALNRKNALFAGHDAGAENWATIASLIETCKLNTVDPLAYLTTTLTAIVNGNKQGQIAGLLPWSYPAIDRSPQAVIRMTYPL